MRFSSSERVSALGKPRNMTFNAASLVAVSYPQAAEIARQINGTGTVNADLLSKIGISGPVAIELARQMSAGVGNVGALFGMGFCASDATAIVAAINARGAH
jgi:hypothetical protein